MTQAFSVMAKPIGSVCNMRCEYCYYIEKENKTQHLCMSNDILEEYIKQYMSSCSASVIPFVWHGGEPTLAGIDFYKKVITLQKKYLPKGKTYLNNLQTNGLLLDDNWCKFLKNEKFDVGISIDGTKIIHDKHRRDTNGNTTFNKIERNIKRLQSYGIQPDLLCTVTSLTAENPISVYRSLKNLNTGWIQFIPIVIFDEDNNLLPISVTSVDYGNFLCSIYDDWKAHDIGKVDIQIFAETSMIWMGKKPSVCMMQETCGNVLVIEKDGSIYSCDHFVDNKHYLGNIKDSDLVELLNSSNQQSFGSLKSTTLSDKCKKCKWLNTCRGGCLKNRRNGLNVLCEGYEIFFKHASASLSKIMEDRINGVSSKDIMNKFK